MASRRPAGLRADSVLRPVGQPPPSGWTPAGNAGDFPTVTAAALRSPDRRSKSRLFREIVHRSGDPGGDVKGDSGPRGRTRAGHAPASRAGGREGIRRVLGERRAGCARTLLTRRSGCASPLFAPSDPVRGGPRPPTYAPCARDVGGPLRLRMRGATVGHVTVRIAMSGPSAGALQETHASRNADPTCSGGGPSDCEGPSRFERR